MAYHSGDFSHFIHAHIDRVLGYIGMVGGLFSWAGLEKIMQLTLLGLSIVFVVLGIALRIRKFRSGEHEE